MYCKVLQANLTGQLAECVVKFLTREAVAHLRVLRPQACHILRHVPVAQDAVSHQLGQLSKLLLAEAEPRYLEQEECFTQNEKQQMLEITEKMSDVTAQDALKNLSSYLNLLYGKKVLIFLDEYDTPMHLPSNYLHNG